ncbi:MAG: hypothetical protein LBG88_04405 [Christensenellaceae bacterium]|jgi:hypothetical protein|nr:hypothetical protein [Christensenellaceae bacterium]
MSKLSSQIDINKFFFHGVCNGPSLDDKGVQRSLLRFDNILRVGALLSIRQQERECGKAFNDACPGRNGLDYISICRPIESVRNAYSSFVSNGLSIILDEEVVLGLPSRLCRDFLPGEFQIKDKIVKDFFVGVGVGEAFRENTRKIKTIIKSNEYNLPIYEI